MKYKDRIEKLNEMDVPTWINYIRTTESNITFLEILLEVIEDQEQLLESNKNYKILSLGEVFNLGTDETG